MVKWCAISYLLFCLSVIPAPAGFLFCFSWLFFENTNEFVYDSDLKNKTRKSHKNPDVKAVYDEIIVPSKLGKIAIKSELGRYITGPHGMLVTHAIHKKDIYKNYIGLDACAANLMRPAMYGSYHHITVMGKENAPCDTLYDVTGGLCENNDKFAVDRMLPKIDIGDIVVLHDTGAHGYAMGYNYNGKLRSAELLLKEDGSVKLIRRAEKPSDYFATFDFEGAEIKVKSEE